MSVDQPTGFVKHQTVTRDAFLGGRLTLAQPAKGFRAGLDSVLLGAAVGRSAGQLLDLGAGVGTAALVALADRPGLDATLLESDPQIAALAAENIASNGFSPRARVLDVDVTAPGRARSSAGLKADHFDAVIANPPFFESGAGTAPALRRVMARQMSAEALELWARTASTHVAPGGAVIFIHVAERLSALLAAFDSRFGAITVLPLIPRDGEPARRILIRGIKGSRAPLTLLASRALHTPAGRGFRAEFEAIFRGDDTLHW